MGIHPEFSSFDRRSAGLDGARHLLWQWAEPVVIDRAVESYARVIDQAGTVAMARKHCRLWGVVLLDRSATVAAAMDDVRRASRSLGLPDALVDETDDLILEELVDIVASRHRASRNAMRAFSLVLMGATSCLGMARAPV